MTIENYMIWIWLGVFVFTLIMEATTQDLVSIWFSLGSLAALCTSAALPYWGEIIVFVVVSCVSLLCTRPLVKRIMDRQIRKTNSDDFVGKRLKVIEDVDKFDGGSVKLNGIIYTAILMDDEYNSIKKDSLVEVVALKGNKVVVKQINDEKE